MEKVEYGRGALGVSGGAGEGAATARGMLEIEIFCGSRDTGTFIVPSTLFFRQMSHRDRVDTSMFGRAGGRGGEAVF